MGCCASQPPPRGATGKARPAHPPAKRPGAKQAAPVAKRGSQQNLKALCKQRSADPTENARGVPARRGFGARRLSLAAGPAPTDSPVSPVSDASHQSAVAADAPNDRNPRADSTDMPHDTFVTRDVVTDGSSEYSSEYSTAHLYDRLDSLMASTCKDTILSDEYCSPRRSSVVYEPREAPLLTYTTLARSAYTIESTIGKGNYGTVFLAQHNPTGTSYAVKEIRDAALSRTGADKLIKEVTMMTSIAHPNVVELYSLEYDPDAFAVWMLMEYVEGARNLGDIRGEHPAGLGEGRARRLFLQLLEGLHAIHLAGIAHRDIKCENVIVGEGDRLKITDFGLSCVQPADDGVVRQEHLLKLQCGTPNYMAPEVVFPEGGYNGLQADMWSAGVVLYGMLTGSLPFKAKSSTKLLIAIGDGKYTIPEEMPAAAADLVTRLLCVEREWRMASGSALEHEWVLANWDEERENVHLVMKASTLEAKKNKSEDLGNSIRSFFEQHGRVDTHIARSLSARDGRWLQERASVGPRRGMTLSSLSVGRPLRRRSPRTPSVSSITPRACPPPMLAPPVFPSPAE